MKKGLHRHPIIGLTNESPMLRFLKQVALAEQHNAPGAYPHYHQQWRTMWMAYRLGFITEGFGEGYGGFLTEMGKEYLNTQQEVVK